EAAGKERGKHHGVVVRPRRSRVGCTLGRDRTAQLGVVGGCVFDHRVSPLDHSPHVVTRPGKRLYTVNHARPYPDAHVTKRESLVTRARWVTDTTGRSGKPAAEQRIGRQTDEAPTVRPAIKAPRERRAVRR